jgi:hypothetical protein
MPPSESMPGNALASQCTQKKVYRGKDGAREVFTQLLGDVPQAQE